MTRRIILAGLDSEQRAEVALALAGNPAPDETDVLAAVLAVLLRPHR